MRLISADTGHRLARPLTELLAATYGPVPVLTDLLSGRSGIEHAYIYGSWAARHAGQAGPVPADLDVLVVGSIDLDDLDEISRTAQERLGMDVNIHRVSPATWTSSKDEPFLTHVRSQPLVELMLREADQLLDGGAVLFPPGLRTTSRGGHIALIDAVTAQLDPPLGTTLRTTNRMRTRRNRIEYPAPDVPPVTEDELAETLPKVEASLDHATKVLDNMPTWT